MHLGQQHFILCLFRSEAILDLNIIAIDWVIHQHLREDNETALICDICINTAFKQDDRIKHMELIHDRKHPPYYKNTFHANRNAKYFI